MMKKIVLLIAFPLFSLTLFSQVGINNTDPKASLEITASNATSPSNTDGILIPRIDEFPSSNPTADQDGMLVFVTGNGTPSEGFYYWNNGTSSWTAIAGVADNDWNISGTFIDSGTRDVYIGPNGAADTDLLISGDILDQDSTIHFIDPNSVSHIFELQMDNGTATDPAINFYFENNTGIYRPEAGSIGIANNGTDKFRFTQQGQLEYYNTGNSIFLGTEAGQNDDLSGRQNIGIGYRALRNNASGARNIAIGTGAMLLSTGGSTNVAIGDDAMAASTSGSNNVSIGTQTLFRNTTGNNNVAVGGTAMRENTIGINNTALGFRALYNTIRNANVAIGYESGFTNSTGTQNTFVGTGTGHLTTGSSNIFLGYNAGYNETGSNKLYIENSNSSNPLIYGEFDTNIIRANGTLQINNPAGTGYQFPTIDGTSGQVLSTDGAGNLSFTAAAADNDWTTTGNDIYSSNTGFVGIGDTTPDYKLDLEYAGTIDRAAGIDYNYTAGTGLSKGLTVSAQTSSSGFLIGFETEITNSNASSETIAIQGINSSNSASKVGLYGNVVGGGTQNTGVNGRADGATTNYGGYFSANSASATTNYGIVAIGENASGTNWAGYFGDASPGSGNVFINDNLRVDGLLGVDPTGSGYMFPAADGTNGQVLTTNGTGTLSFADAPMDTDWTDVGADIERQSGDVYIGDTFNTNNDLYISDRIIDWDSNTYYLDPATGSRLNEVDFDSGNVSDPSVTFTDPDTGIFASLTGYLDFTNNGTTTMSLRSNNHIAVNTIFDYGQLGVVSEDFGTETISARNTDAGTGVDINITGNKSTFGGTMTALNISQTGTSTADVNKFGIYNSSNGSGAGDITAIRNWIQSGSSYSGFVFGTRNDILYNSSLSTYAVYNNLTGTNTGTEYGTYNTISGGNSNKYGTYTSIGSSEGGTHYGIYTDVQKSTGFAAYHIGRTYLGESTINRYFMPAADGTSGQVITTDGVGNLSWTNTSSESTTANNGLTETGDNIQLGGALTQATTITQGANSLNFNLNGTGDFNITDNGNDAFTVEDSGEVGIGTSGPIARLDVRETSNTASQAIYLIKTDNSSSFNSAMQIERTSNGTGVTRGIDLNYYGTGTGAHYGMDVLFSGSGGAFRNAFNSEFTGTATGSKRGLSTDFAGSGSGSRTGMYTDFGSSVNGAQYGVYSQFDGSNGSYTGVQNVMSGSTNNAAFGMFNSLVGTGTGAKTGVSNSFSGANGNANVYVGVDNSLNDTGNGNRWGVRNNLDGTGNGIQYGTWNDLTGSGSGDKYGSYNNIDSGAGGTHYGTYSQVNVSSGWAGYFLGRNYMQDRLSIGELDNANAGLNVSGNSGGTISQIEVEETVANDGARIRFTNSAETTNQWLLFGRADNTTADSRFNINHTSTGNIIHIRGDGRVGINNSAPTYALELPNNATVSVGQARANAWITYSDGRIKKNQETMSYGLMEILQLKPKSYQQFASKFEDGELRLKEGSEQDNIGFIAQEVYHILPEVVHKPQDESNDLWSVDYEKVVPVTVKAIQELYDKITNLESENAELKSMVLKYAQLESRLKALEGTPISAENN